MSEEENELSREEKEERYRKAGEIAQAVKKELEKLVKVGARVIDICESVEKLIREKGGQPAFPCNVSMNNVAAHYTSPPRDETIIEDESVVKVDIGVHVDGYIADTAVTFCFNSEFERLKEAAEAALKVALENIKAGVRTNEIGRLIEEKIREYGYRPIRNLTGHLLEEYSLHGAKTIPNIGLPSGDVMEEGEVFAVEVFATTGTGVVREAPYAYIYRLLPVRVPVRLTSSRKLLRIAADRFKGLPFAERWLVKEIPAVKLALKELSTKGILYEYKVLSDIKGSMVAQAEETVIVRKDGCEITTS
ncbi:MAG: type II methionyl aminopeptidase [Candidatus Baldrarchaeia archaeon]